jgi:hypothetical protein
LFGSISAIVHVFMATGIYLKGILVARLTPKVADKILIDRTESDYIRAFNADRFSYRGIGISGQH